MSRAWMVVPLAVVAVGVAFAGPWVLAGAAAGAASAWVARRMGLPWSAAALAAAIPPGFALGPAAAGMALLAALAAVRVWRPHLWLLTLGVLGMLLPGPAAFLVPAAAGGLHFAVAPGPLALVGVLVALAPWAVAPSGIPWAAVVALAAGALARWVAAHPANLSMARRVAVLGLVAAPLPAAAGLLLAGLGRGPVAAEVVLAAAVGAAGIGALLALSHVGMMPVFRARDADGALWLACLWVGALLPLASVAQFGARDGLAASLPLLGLLAVPAALGSVWLYPHLSTSIGTRESTPLATSESQ